MTNIQIQYFLDIVRTKNITHTARERFVSQQVVSKQLKHLEEELGFPLFIRDKAGLVLTEGGRILYDFWSEASRNQKIVLEQARSAMKIKNETVRVGILDVSCLYDMVAEAAIHVDQMDGASTILTETGSYLELYRNLIDHKYDCILSIADENGNLPEDLETETLLEMWPKIIISDQHPAYRPGMRLRDLADSEIYLLSSAFSKNAEKNILGYCQMYGYQPKKIRYFDSIASLEMALHGRKGFTILYDVFIRNTTGHLQTVDMEHQENYVSNYLQVAYQKSKKKVLKPFLEQLKLAQHE